MDETQIRSELKAQYAVEFFDFCRKHYDRNVARSWIRFENPADIQSGHFRQHQIKHDERRRQILYGIESRVAVVGDLNAESSSLQVMRQEIRNISFILYDQNFFSNHKESDQ